MNAPNTLGHACWDGQYVHRSILNRSPIVQPQDLLLRVPSMINGMASLLRASVQYMDRWRHHPNFCPCDLQSHATKDPIYMDPVNRTTHKKKQQRQINKITPFRLNVFRNRLRENIFLPS